MTLEEMLSLLPDSPPGNISAGDLRAIVTELYEAAHTVAVRHTYRWTNDTTPPATGRINLIWGSGPATVHLSETGADGSITPFRDNTGNRIIIDGPGHQLQGVITGIGVDQGGYHDLPVEIETVIGDTPTNDTQLNVYVVGMVP